MKRIVWLLILLIPPCLASTFEAPRWVALASAVPILVFAIATDDSHERESSAFGRSVLALMIIGGLVMGGTFFVVLRALFTGK